MISLQHLKKAGWKRIYMTSQEVRNVRQNLENKTEKSFKKYATTKIYSQARAHYIILD